MEQRKEAGFGLPLFAPGLRAESFAARLHLMQHGWRRATNDIGISPAETREWREL
jgi:hypothetical protein